MKAIKQPSQDFHSQHQEVIQAPSLQNEFPVTDAIVLQRRSACPCGGGCPLCEEDMVIQLKLRIGEPGDRYEQEADRVADEVMRMPDPFALHKIKPEDKKEETLQTKSQLNIQRQCQEKELESAEEQIQPKTDIPRIDINSKTYSLQSSGRQLSLEERRYFEPRFGYDFSRVRVHTDAGAMKSAQAFGARAYTIGSDIFIGSERYRPTTNEGRWLLTHELTHVVQQGGGVRGDERNLELQAITQETDVDSLKFATTASAGPNSKRLQLKPDHIISITVDLGSSRVLHIVDDGTTVPGSIVGDTNLSLGSYNAQWDEERGGLQISPHPTEEDDIQFNVSFTEEFSERAEALLRYITAPIPFTVVSQSPEQEVAETEIAPVAGYEVRISRDNPNLITFSSPLSQDEAIRYLWHQPPSSPDAIRPDPEEEAHEGRQTRYLININEDLDLIFGMRHGLDQYFLRRIRGGVIRAQGAPNIPGWVPSDVREGLISRTLPSGVITLSPPMRGGEDEPPWGRIIVWIGSSGGFQIYREFPTEMSYYEGLTGGNEYQAHILQQHYTDLNEQWWILVSERGLTPAEAWDLIRQRSIEELRGIISISTTVALAGAGFLGSAPPPGGAHVPRGQSVNVRLRRVVRRRQLPLRREEPGMAAWRENIGTRPPRRWIGRPRIPHGTPGGTPGNTGWRHLPREFRMPNRSISSFPRSRQQLGTSEQRGGGRSGLREHWRQHGHEFPEHQNARQYEQGAINFCRDESTYRFYYRYHGRPTIGYYNRRTGTFAATSVDGRTIYTYFRSGSDKIDQTIRNLRMPETAPGMPRTMPEGVEPRHSVPLRRLR